MEVICLSYSPQILNPGRYWLASGSRDKLITLYDSSEDYEALTCFEQHTGSISSICFSSKDPTKMSLISGSADKRIITREIDL
jgi:WD40 repeat protein